MFAWLIISMELRELKKHINDAIKDCQQIIDSHPNSVLSESDLERLLSGLVSNKIGEDIKRQPSPDCFSVHTQVSHYFEKDGAVEMDSRVDILLLKESGLTTSLHHKEFKYEGDSIAMELKYFHKNDKIDKVKCDFCKWGRLREDSCLYVVVLIDFVDSTEGRKKYTEKKKQIDQLYKEKKQQIRSSKGNQLFYKVLKKRI